MSRYWLHLVDLALANFFVVFMLTTFVYWLMYGRRQLRRAALVGFLVGGLVAIASIFIMHKPEPSLPPNLDYLNATTTVVWNGVSALNLEPGQRVTLTSHRAANSDPGRPRGYAVFGHLFYVEGTQDLRVMITWVDSCYQAPKDTFPTPIRFWKIQTAHLGFTPQQEYEVRSLLMKTGTGDYFRPGLVALRDYLEGQSVTIQRNMVQTINVAVPMCDCRCIRSDSIGLRGWYPSLRHLMIAWNRR